MRLPRPRDLRLPIEGMCGYVSWQDAVLLGGAGVRGRGNTMDHAAGTGLIGAAFAVARSYQPNLLTRASRDQAIITGVTSAGAYGVFSAGDSILGAIASRVSRTEEARPSARLLVAGVTGVASAGVALALPWKEHENSRRAVVRLVSQTTAAIAAASAVTTAPGSDTSGKSPPARSAGGGSNVITLRTRR